MSLYREDLAHIHDVGFGDFARRASVGLLRMIDAGWRVWGVDLSPAMIAIARNRVPEARFQVGSLFDVRIPPCRAATAIGESLCYLTDEERPSARLGSIFDRVHAALEPGGTLIFDLVEPGRGSERVDKRIDGAGWTVRVETVEDRDAGILTRRIVTEREIDGGSRRDEEVHRLMLYRRDEVVAELGRVGFDVEILESYGNTMLAEHVVGYLARTVDG